mmetsp:Transcript_9053/g.25944  ORF Transcript_9053/g.25944 Transcript_9053/m.25944 type:complete len:243 (+) Transcript_9053:740-1468(+)
MLLHPEAEDEEAHDGGVEGDDGRDVALEFIAPHGDKPHPGLGGDEAAEHGAEGQDDAVDARPSHGEAQHPRLEAHDAAEGRAVGFGPDLGQVALPDDAREDEDGEDDGGAEGHLAIVEQNGADGEGDAGDHGLAAPAAEDLLHLGLHVLQDALGDGLGLGELLGALLRGGLLLLRRRCGRHVAHRAAKGERGIADGGRRGGQQRGEGEGEADHGAAELCAGGGSGGKRRAGADTHPHLRARK